MTACYIRILSPNGVHGVSYTADSLNQAAQYEPSDGIYTVTNTYNTFQVLKFDAHLDRLEDSARRENISLSLDRPRLKKTLRQMIEDSGFGDVRFRITVPRADPQSMIISLEAFAPPPETVYRQGVRVMTVPNSARSNPAAKSTAWMHDRQRISAALPPGIYDAILLDAKGNLLEGLSSNFYAIIDGALYTAGEGVLPGIAQQIVFSIAPEILPLHQTAVNVGDLSRLEEAFITSSSRGIVPVVEIDGQYLGDGTPGKYTRALREAYLAWLQTHLETL